MDWLPWADCCYNTSFHMVLCTTPFEVVYGQPPSPLLSHIAGVAQTEGVDSLLRDHDAFLAEVRERLLQVQKYVKRHYDEHQYELEFTMGDWVWLRLLHHTTHSFATQPKGKLGPRYAGPF